MNTVADSVRRPETVVITLDGRQLTFADKHTTPADVLRAGGLDPDLYDLVKVKKNSTDKLADDAPLTLKDGDEFISQRQSAPVE